MPLATIWRDPKKVTSTKAAAIRNVVHFAVQATLKVEPEEVEIRVRDIGPLDLNYMPIGVEIDTGAGKDRWRIEQKKAIAIEVAERISASNLLEADWIGPDKSYVWLRICESSFVPIGHPDHAR